MTTSYTLHDLQRLEQLYSTGFHDAFLDSALRKVLDRQISRDRGDLTRVRKALARFEKQYGLNSDEFWPRFQAGQMPDTADYMEWNIFCKMRQRILARLQILQEGRVHE